MHMRRGEYMLEEVAKDAWEYGRKFLLQGKVADYIPELGKANPVHFGLCIKTEDGRHIEFGDSERRFTIQSICKIVSLAAALQYIGEEKVFRNVMMEPSGDAFNSILKLDTASMPQGPQDMCGLTSYELCMMLHEAGLAGAKGMDFVEIYPDTLSYQTAAHDACWATLYYLNGLAERKKNEGEQK